MTPSEPHSDAGRNTDVAWLCAAMLPVALAALLPALAIPAFGDVFAGFGANLP